MKKADLLSIEPLPIKRHGAVIFDESNPRSVYNIAPQKIKDCIRKLYAEKPEFTGKTEYELHRLLKPDDDTDRLRLSFWQEYCRAQDHNVKMKADNIYAPVMAASTFYVTFMSKNEVIAWMLVPPQDYMLALEGFLNHAKDSLGSLLKMPLFDEKGRLKAKEANIFLKAYELLDSRVKGSVIQRIEQRTQSLQVTATHADLRKELEVLSSKDTLFLDKPPVENQFPTNGKINDLVPIYASQGEIDEDDDE